MQLPQFQGGDTSFQLMQSQWASILNPIIEKEIIYVSKQVTPNLFVDAATGVWFDAANLDLTAGDWDITGQIIGTANGGTITNFQMGISTASGNQTVGLTYGDNWTEWPPQTAAAASTGSVENYRVKISKTTRYYLKAVFAYTVAHPKIYGRISARRMEMF